jgi:transcriptional regulator of acetoin/glycerol metabolism
MPSMSITPELPGLPVPSGLPPLHISESWQRCRGMGLDCGFNPQPNAVSRHEVRHLLERDLLLATVTVEELRTLGQAMADTGHVVILIDDQGHIVSVVGEAASRGPVLRHARSGVDCSEPRFGTNAAGTALVERKPVLVRRSEHYFQDLRHMDCLAAPIFRPGGELIGVLDVSCETRPLVPGLLELVQSSVLRIERLLLRELRSPHILRLHPHPGCIGTPYEGLVALGEGGEILGLNTLGARLLGSSQREAVGRCVNELLGTGLRQLDRRSGEAVNLRTPDGLGVYATLAEADDLAGRHRRQPAPPAASQCALQQQRMPADDLTRRERRILCELDSGLSNRQIAAALFISEGTLKWHLHNIYDKLGARSRAGALARARKLGLLDAV